MKCIVQIYLPILLVTGIFIASPTACCAAADALTAANITGANSRIAKREYQRLTSRKQLAELWSRHRGPGHAVVPAGLHRVDFRKFMIIGIFEGLSLNGSHIRIESVLEDRERIVLRYKTLGYQTVGPDGGGIHAVFMDSSLFPGRINHWY